MTGNGVEINAVQNYFSCLVGLKNEELKLNIKIKNLYLEMESVGTGLEGNVSNTDEARPMKYQEAINGIDGAGQREETINA